jgi:hypothetical protein
MSSIFRDAELMQILARHPLRSSLAKVLDTAEAFQDDVEFLELNKDLSPQGRRKSLQGHLRKAVRDLRDLRAPITELQAKLEAKTAAVQRPPLDMTAKAADDRREARTILRGMDRDERALLLSGAGSDAEFVDAMLEKNPRWSGLLPNEQFLVDAAKEQRLAGLYGSELAEIEELKATIAEANMVVDRAHVHLKLHSAMDDRDFADFVAPIMNRKRALAGKKRRHGYARAARNERDAAIASAGDARRNFRWRVFQRRS